MHGRTLPFTMNPTGQPAISVPAEKTAMVCPLNSKSLAGICQSACVACCSCLMDCSGPQNLDHYWSEFCGHDPRDGLVTPPGFCTVIGTLYPIALRGRTSL